jgi:hypothetical protein
MNGRTPTKDEKIWLEKCQQIPCIVCAMFHGIADSPAEIHHTDGQQKPNAHLKTLSLCTRHHRISDNRHPKRWISRHGDGKLLFQSRYMPERELLEYQALQVRSLEENCI